MAALHVAANSLYLDYCIAVRIGTGVVSAPGLSGYLGSLLVWWHPAAPIQIFTVESSPAEKLNLRLILGATNELHHWAQFLMASRETRRPLVPLTQ